ncbi:hypothetical protein [uncultured Flavobacterium sp.]|uniref:hypothetical protein n=1 Tax=uncultured Flavobacterium sp. TaxID=165435 RepID=UPI0030ECC559|tara:strand:- start:897 stop:1100 length:204 start_codon:yes stop_codon:yes gene_type:complete
MEQKEKKINLAFDINKELQKQITSSKIVKYALYGLTVVGGILAIGFLSKVLNYTFTNISELKKTLKQ